MKRSALLIQAVIGLVLWGVALSADQTTKPQVPTNKGVPKEHGSLSGVKPDQTAKNQGAPAHVAPPVADGVAAKNQQAEAEQRKENIEIQRKLVTATRGLVGVGALQFLILVVQAIAFYLTLRAINRQVVANEKSANAAKTNSEALVSSERAWMIGSPNMRELDSYPEFGGKLLYVCNLKNAGRTPARILQTGLAFRTANSVGDIPKTPIYKKEGEVSSFNKLLLLPEDSFASTTIAMVTREEYLAVKDPEKRLMLYAYGFVKYLDVFDKSHETCFCHYYHVPGADELQKERFQLCVEAPPNTTRQLSRQISAAIQIGTLPGIAPSPLVAPRGL